MSLYLYLIVARDQFNKCVMIAVAHKVRATFVTKKIDEMRGHKTATVRH